MKKIINSIVENSTGITIKQLKEIADKTPADISIECIEGTLFSVTIETDDDIYSFDLESNIEEVEQLCTELEIEVRNEEKYYL